MKKRTLSQIVVENIVVLRKEKGWTQEQFAQRLKKTQSWLNKLENGKAVPTLPTIEHIAKVLHVAVFQLFIEGKIV